MMEKINNLQGLRFIGFFMIFLHHCYQYAAQNELFNLGGRGVEIFIVLSGYLIAYNYSNRTFDVNLKSSWLYMISKIKKFYLLHIITFLVFFFNQIKHDDTLTHLPEFITNAILNITLLKSWYYPAAFSFNGVSWFLCVLVFAYFFVPKVVMTLKNKSLSFIFYLFIFLLTCKFMVDTFAGSIYPGMVSDPQLSFILYLSPAYRFIDFLLGYLAYMILKNITFNLSALKISIIQLVSISIYYICCIIFDKIWTSAEFIVATILLISACTMKDGILDKILGNKPIVYLGNISFELFILHQMVIVFIPKISHDILNLNGYLIISIMFIVTLLLSSLAYHKLRRKKLPVQ